jgi:hypothetical protein
MEREQATRFVSGRNHKMSARKKTKIRLGDELEERGRTEREEAVPATAPSSVQVRALLFDQIQRVQVDFDQRVLVQRVAPARQRRAVK